MDARFPLATSTWDEKEYESLQRVISSGMFSMGTEVSTFEKQFASGAVNSVYIYGGRTTKPYKGLQSGRSIQYRNDDEKFINEKFHRSNRIKKSIWKW